MFVGPDYAGTHNYGLTPGVWTTPMLLNTGPWVEAKGSPEPGRRAVRSVHFEPKNVHWLPGQVLFGIHTPRDETPVGACTASSLTVVKTLASRKIAFFEEKPLVGLDGTHDALTTCKRLRRLLRVLRVLRHPQGCVSLASPGSRGA